VEKPLSIRKTVPTFSVLELNEDELEVEIELNEDEPILQAEKTMPLLVDALTSRLKSTAWPVFW
jgi:hypothetical protein